MKYTEELAEIIGIMLGDGCLYKAKKGELDAYNRPKQDVIKGAVIFISENVLKI